MGSPSNAPELEMLDLHVPATVAGMEIVHRELARCCLTLQQARSLENRWIDELTLAVAEVAANIIQHSPYPDSPLVQFALSLTHYPDRLAARFVDRGIVAKPPGTLLEMPPVDAPYADLGERGRGLALVQMTTDRFEYQRTPDGQNIWIIEKDFPA